MERKEIVRAAKELNEVLGLDPVINITLAVGQVKAAVLEASGLIAEGDELTDETLATLAALKNGSGDLRTAAEQKSDGKDGSEMDGSEMDVKAKEQSKVKKDAKDVKSDRGEGKRDEFGFMMGSKVHKAIKLLISGKTMSDVKKAMGTTFYEALKKMGKAGHKITKHEDGTYQIQLKKAV
jgi:hypothetical protein